MKTILELADDYAKAYFMGRPEEARKLLQAAIIQNEVQMENDFTKSLDELTWRKELLKVKNELNQYRTYADELEARIEELDSLEPDMFWNHDDAEKLYGSVDEFLNDEICSGAPVEVGDTRTIQCTIRLPNFDIKITKSMKKNVKLTMKRYNRTTIAPSNPANCARVGWRAARTYEDLTNLKPDGPQTNGKINFDQVLENMWKHLTEN